jgi:EAL domain-containing protein (putative c-di-GMP-specific phosphodiesterase class I)/CheY-like chemotaxis protein
MERIRVVIADDEPTIREALSDLIEAQPSMEVLAAVGDAEAAVEAARLHLPDVVLVDVKMPGGGGPRAARDIRRYCPHTRVVALSAHEDRASVLEMLRAGAVGYLVKGVSTEEILETIRRAHLGQASLSAHVTDHVVHELAGQLERQGREAEERQAQVERIRSVLRRDVMRMVYQPIADLRDGRIVGVEALARIHADPVRPPDAWFDEARSVGLGLELEMAAVRKALAELGRIPQDVYLAINVSPATVATDDFLKGLARSPGHRVVIEVTEHAPVEDYGSMRRDLDPVLQLGVRVAVDDAGAGFASLRHILQLSPNIIKLDMSLTRGIDRDQARRALAAGLISFAGEISATIVAEGIESREELETLGSLGVSFGQGFFIGEPGPLPNSYTVPALLSA